MSDSIEPMKKQGSVRTREESSENGFSTLPKTLDAIVGEIVLQEYPEIDDVESASSAKKQQLQECLHEVASLISESLECKMATAVYNDAKSNVEKFYIFDLAHYILNESLEGRYDEDVLKPIARSGKGGAFMKEFCDIVGSELNEVLQGGHVQKALKSMLNHVMIGSVQDLNEYCNLVAQQQSENTSDGRYNVEVLKNSLVLNTKEEKEAGFGLGVGGSPLAAKATNVFGINLAKDTVASL